MKPEEQQQTPPVQDESQNAPEPVAPPEPTEAAPQAPDPAAAQAAAPEAPPAPPAEVAATVAAPPAAEEDESDEFDIPTFNLYPQTPYQYPGNQPQQPAPQSQEQSQTQQASQQPQGPQVPALNLTDFTNNLGEVDMGKFTQALEARDKLMTTQVAQQVSQQVMQHLVPAVSQEASRTVLAAKREEQLWNKAFAKYPQIQESKDLRDLVHKTRLGEFQTTGKEVSPLKAAERLFKHLGNARTEGEKSATESVRVQASAHLETASNTASDKATEVRDNFSQIGNRDRRVADNARTNLLKQWLSDGKI